MTAKKKPDADAIIDRLIIERVPIDAVHPHPENARRGNLDTIAASLQSHGQFRPLVVQRSTSHILVGNHTWLAASEKLRWPHIDITYVDVTDDRARRVMLVENAANDQAGYDENALLALIKTLDGTEGEHHTWAGFEHAVDLSGTGFDDAMLTKLVEKLAGPSSPDGFPDPEDGMETAYQCPGCGYEWSGLPKPNERQDVAGEGGGVVREPAAGGNPAA